MSKLPKFSMARTFQKNIVKKSQIVPDVCLQDVLGNCLSFQMIPMSIVQYCAVTTIFSREFPNFTRKHALNSRARLKSAEIGRDLGPFL